MFNTDGEFLFYNFMTEIKQTRSNKLTQNKPKLVSFGFYQIFLSLYQIGTKV